MEFVLASKHIIYFSLYADENAAIYVVHWYIRFQSFHAYIFTYHAGKCKISFNYCLTMVADDSKMFK